MSSTAIHTAPEVLIEEADEIRQIIEDAKQRSMEHIHGLGKRVNQFYEGYSEAILDAVRPYLKVPAS
ncbi:hypothetical protein FA13DRAFT_1736411 [Coprinellus micaceus]|uniref:Uncharacterized protein n=1 Tax=Coprinellus micaceus TaxID=71717 RepID=A0A4Y7T0A8_COPMI|nr:hypothetical protein FA13DRAFT_1736411 [Coprinellus micaceus]